MGKGATLLRENSAFQGDANALDSVLSSPHSILHEAESKGSEACFERAQELWQGSRIRPRNRGEAALWLEQAALKGHPEAMFQLAEALRWGDGLLRDPAQAEAWYQRAAEAGHERAIQWLAHAYLVGDGVKPDLEEVAYWRKRSGRRDWKVFFWVSLGIAVGLGIAAQVWWLWDYRPR